ncbi:hypothetical protein FHT80_003056 [Rhizobium sp. BK226]|uniref:hypothetical protein n=1 Tax=Rhizobium sp. BK226 TaxID=2587075 RepID=UPI00161F0DDA|nr:hypothetical protein [Rhizobium sp. BK226]MBB4113730.1 hypothetical protein [Rhizobium sp. BK226]
MSFVPKHVLDVVTDWFHEIEEDRSIRRADEDFRRKSPDLCEILDQFQHISGDRHAEACTGNHNKDAFCQNTIKDCHHPWHYTSANDAPSRCVLPSPASLSSYIPHEIVTAADIHAQLLISNLDTTPNLCWSTINPTDNDPIKQPFMIEVRILKNFRIQ